MIPKRIHFYWGNDKMSFLRYMTLKSFRYFNPDWEINLITNDKSSENFMKWTTLEKQDKVGYKGIDYFSKIQDLNVNIIPLDYDLFVNEIDPQMSDVHISDFLGWWLMWKEGGFIADMDILFTKPLDNLLVSLNPATNMAMVMFSRFDNYMPVSFMAGDGNDNAFYRDTFLRAKDNYDPTVYQSAGSNCIPFKSSEEIKEVYPDLTYTKLIDSVVFPFHEQLDGNWAKFCFIGNRIKFLNPAHVGIHWYAGTPISQEWNNMITEETYMNYQNTICHIIKNDIR